MSTIYACIVTPKICSGLTFFLFSNDNYISVLHNIFWMNIILFMLAWFGNELALDQYMCIICNTQYNNYYWLTRYNDWSKWFYISSFSPFINPIFMSMVKVEKQLKYYLGCEKYCWRPKKRYGWKSFKCQNTINCLFLTRQ